MKNLGKIISGHLFKKRKLVEVFLLPLLSTAIVLSGITTVFSFVSIADAYTSPGVPTGYVNVYVHSFSYFKMVTLQGVEPCFSH